MRVAGNRLSVCKIFGAKDERDCNMGLVIRRRALGPAFTQGYTSGRRHLVHSNPAVAIINSGKRRQSHLILGLAETALKRGASGEQAGTSLFTGFAFDAVSPLDSRARAMITARNSGETKAGEF